MLHEYPSLPGVASAACMAHPRRLELLTCGLEDRCSIQLSYRCVTLKKPQLGLVSPVFFYGCSMNDECPKILEANRVNNFVRHANSRYYARLYRNGKEI